MSLPILQPSSTETTQIRGEVIIDSSVIIASGVILNATPGYTITIHAGVCLGMGTIITAHEGDVEIRANAILGPGTLILGSCVIGSQVSLGTSVTIYHAEIEDLAVIPAGTIIGDRSRQVKLEVKEEEEKTSTAQNQSNQEVNLIDKINELNKNNYSRTVNQNSEQAQSKPKPEPETTIASQINSPSHSPPATSKTVANNQPQKSTGQNPESKQQTDTTNHLDSNKEESTSSAKNATNANNSSSKSESKEVVGKVYINRLLYTLFPEKNYRKNN